MNEVVVMEDGSGIPQEAVLVIRNEDIAQLLIQRYKEDSALREDSLKRAIDVAGKPMVKLYQKWVRLVYDAYMEAHGTELQALITEINKFSTYSYKLSIGPKEKLKGYDGRGTQEGLSLEAAAHLVDEHDPAVQKYRYNTRDHGLKRYFNLYGVHTSKSYCDGDRSGLHWVEGKRVILKSKLEIVFPVERTKLTEKENKETQRRYGNLPEECKFPISLKKKYFEVPVTEEMRLVFDQIQDVLNKVLRAAKADCENAARMTESALKEFSERVRARITEHALQDLDIKEHMLSIYTEAAGGQQINLLGSDDEDDEVDDDDFVETEEDNEVDDDESEEEVEDEEEDEDE